MRTRDICREGLAPWHNNWFSLVLQNRKHVTVWTPKKCATGSDQFPGPRNLRLSSRPASSGRLNRLCPSAMSASPDNFTDAPEAGPKSYTQTGTNCGKRNFLHDFASSMGKW